MNTLLEPCKIYHIYNHAVGEANLFRSDKNYDYFLKKYAQYISPICNTYAYCLMPNHFHFMMRVKEEQELEKYHEELQKLKAEKNKPKSNTFVAKEIKPIDFPDFVMQQFQNILPAP